MAERESSSGNAFSCRFSRRMSMKASSSSGSLGWATAPPGRAGGKSCCVSGPRIKRIHPDAGLVEQQQFRGAGQGAGQPEFLFHAAGKLAGGPVGEARKIGHLQQLGKRVAAFLRGNAVKVGIKRQILHHAQIFIQPEALGHVTDAILNLLGRRPDIDAKHVEVAGRGRHQTGDHAHQGRLARAVGPHQRGERSRPHPRRYAVHRVQGGRAGEGLDQFRRDDHVIVPVHDRVTPLRCPIARSPAAPGATGFRDRRPRPGLHRPGWCATPRSAPTWA